MYSQGKGQNLLAIFIGGPSPGDDLIRAYQYQW